MDNLTHTAIGLFLSRAGLNRWTPAATPILLLAANAPDIDIVSAAGGSLNYLHFHRHITHSLVAAPVLAIVVVLLVRFIGRRPVQWLGAFGAALIGLASHLLLDLTNMYGIRLLLPFSSAWQRLDLTSVIDLWIWAVLLLGILGPLVARLVGGEISSGALRPKYPPRGGAIFALVFVLLYNCGRQVAHTRAVAILESHIYQGHPPARVAALPDEVNPLRWKGVVETSDFYAVADVDLTGEFDAGRAAIWIKPDPDPALDAARRSRTFQEFLRFAQYPYFRVLPVAEPEGAKEVQFVDVRFGTFEARAVVNARLQVVDEFFQLNGSR